MGQVTTLAEVNAKPLSGGSVGKGCSDGGTAGGADS